MENKNFQPPIGLSNSFRTRLEFHLLHLTHSRNSTKFANTRARAQKQTITKLLFSLWLFVSLCLVICYRCKFFLFCFPLQLFVLLSHTQQRYQKYERNACKQFRLGRFYAHTRRVHRNAKIALLSAVVLARADKADEERRQRHTLEFCQMMSEFSGRLRSARNQHAAYIYTCDWLARDICRYVVGQQQLKNRL